MIRRRLNTINFLLRVITLLLPFLAFAFAGYLRFFSGLIPSTSPVVDLSDYFGLLLFTTVVWAVVVDHYGLFRFDHLFSEGKAGSSVFWACCLTYVAVTGATFFYRSTSFSRLFVAISAVALFLLALLTESLCEALLNAEKGSGAEARILVIGADGFARRTTESLLKRMWMPCRVTAFVRLAGQEVAVEGSPVIALEDAGEVAAAHELDDVVIAIPTTRFSEMPAIMALLRDVCVPVRAVLDLGENVSVREMLFNLGGIRMLDLRPSPSESLVYVIAKRSFDLVVAGLALVALGPLMALIAMAVRITSPGPALFIQERVGLNGRLFRMHKFRTMRTGDSRESATRWTTENDPRCTRFGSFLRRTNLDELPQFLDVLKGDMSIVGPRPERPHFVQKFLEDVAQYNTRHYLKVGITGWAQVNGWRGDTSISRRVEHDLYYLRNWSLLLDFKIVLLTIYRMFAANRNAY